MLVLVELLMGCEQQNQIQQEYLAQKPKLEYVIQETSLGHTVLINLDQDYTFRNDVEVVLQDEQFRTHIAFWSTICGYCFFAIPFTEVKPIIVVLP